MTEDDSKKEELNEPELVVLDSKDSLLEHLKDLMPKKEEAIPDFESYSFDLKNDDKNSKGMIFFFKDEESIKEISAVVKGTEEAKKEIPTEPHVMAKFPTCVTGPYSDIPMRDLEMVDYEAELVLAIGKSGLSISKANAWEHIAGIMLGNDISDRNEQFRLPLKQFSMAKSYDHFGPIGPVLVTPDGFDNPEDLNISLNVDGEERQNARTGDFIFSIPVLIEWLSRYVTLNQGDLIFTGTPGGVGDSMDPPTYIRDGQIVDATLEGVGSLRNRFITGDMK